MDEFSTPPCGRIIRVDPWPTMRVLGDSKRDDHRPCVTLTIPVRRAGVIIRELTPPAPLFPFDAA